jgi:hypothetical protein
VVIAKPQEFETARDSIANLGYEVDFLWNRQLRERRALVNGTRARRKLEIRLPLFPPYGFVLVRFGVDCYDIDTATGVKKLLRHAPHEGQRIGRPKRIRSSLVQGFRDACAAGEFDDPALRPKPEIRTDLNIGAKVRRRDRMSDIIFTVRQLTEDGRVRYFNEMFGGNEGWFTREESDSLELVGA